MKSYLSTTLAFGLLVGSVSAADKADLKDPKQKASYAIGMNIGNSLKEAGADVDTAIIAKGLADAFVGKPGMTDEEARAAMEAFSLSMRAKMAEKLKGPGETFLAENAKKEGVKVLPSGLQYKVMKTGAGKSPKDTDTVRAHYHGTLINGTVFDSSVDRKVPLEIPVNGVIPGWTEALKLMKEGDKWQLFIPYKLAYGEQGSGDVIPPFAALIFEVELIAVLPAAK